MSLQESSLDLAMVLFGSAVIGNPPNTPGFIDLLTTFLNKLS